MEPRVLAHEIKGDGEPVVLVPGGLTGWVSWIPHAERLSARWRTIRVQPIHNELGSAGQPGDPGYTAETERESLRMTLDALGIETAHFAGWSAGGKALIEFALAYPRLVRTLTLVEPGAFWILEQLGVADPDVGRTNTFIHELFGKDVTEDDLAAFLEAAGLASSKEEARRDPFSSSCTVSSIHSSNSSMDQDHVSGKSRSRHSPSDVAFRAAASMSAKF